MIWLSLITASAQPGESGLSKAAKILSTFAVKSLLPDCAIAMTESSSKARAKTNTRREQGIGFIVVSSLVERVSISSERRRRSAAPHADFVVVASEGRRGLPFGHSSFGIRRPPPKAVAFG